jgi:hypothetical protein
MRVLPRQAHRRQTTQQQPKPCEKPRRIPSLPLQDNINPAFALLFPKERK